MRPVFTKGALAVSVAALVLTGCGGGSEPGGGGGGGKETRGPITFATGKDTSGQLQGILDLWNKDHPKEKVKLLELSESADEQRNAMVQNFQAKSSTYDVVNADVIWTAEFAARDWLEELGDAAQPSGIIPAVMETAKYNNKIYAAPWTSDGGMLYYRSDLVKTPPKTWDELKQACTSIAKPKNMDCYAGQFAQYEGLTVNASEAINSAGGEIMKNSGKDVAVDSPEARKGLQFLVDGFKQGWIPKAAITYKEEEGRRSFQQGKLLFLRNWPYVYGLASKQGPDSKIVGKFAVAPLPGPDGPGASTLGGHNLALSAFSKNKATARDWIKFMQSESTQRAIAQKMFLAPVLESLYDDPELVKALPYLPTLKESILKAKVRPVTPNYNQVTVAIEKQSYAALQGTKSVDQAIKDLASDLEQASKRS